MIYDLPQVSEVQRFFLQCFGLRELTMDTVGNGETNGFCLLTDSNLEQALHYCEERKPRLVFVATWSLSEAPMAARSKLFPRLHRTAVKYLISYQPTWGGLDNETYFDNFCQSNSVGSWVQSELHGSRYLFA
jgi:hypothetical protein